ncbi:hypothetical protein FBUS_04969 [Fasciolopsis buskii]|uniref:Uncharacterized protein n=1 Tax=Fasciolopsis buskii TaxID=27845 RepID=A0A8E0VKF6_9TREM|nr:hypothetical protein FBUS_04969 [Fasciolopsis buski]
MIPSVKERQKGAYDFKTFYESVCALNNVVPLQSVTCHLPEGILDIIVDRIRLPDWDPIIKSLRINRNLNFVAFRSFLKTNIEKGETHEIRLGIMQNRTLKHLSFEGSPVGDEGLQELCRAIRNAPELATLNLTGCCITAQGIEYLTQLIKVSLSLGPGRLAIFWPSQSVV